MFKGSPSVESTGTGLNARPMTRRRDRRDPADARPPRPLRAHPHVVKAGIQGAGLGNRRGTVELAGLVLLDSGKLQQEFAKRQVRRETRDPARAATFEKRDRDALAAAEDLAADGLDGVLDPATATAARAATAGESNDDGGRPPVAIPVGERRQFDDPRVDVAHFGNRRSDAGPPSLKSAGEAGGAADPVSPSDRVSPPRASAEAPPTASVSTPTSAAPTRATPPTTIARDPEQALVRQPPVLDADLDEPLYDAQDAQAALASFRGIGVRRARSR